MGSRLSLNQQGFAEKYLAPFLTGLSYLAVHPTAQRIKHESYSLLRGCDENPLLQRPARPYILGEIAAAVAFPLLSLKGLDNLLQQDDPSLLGATLGTVAIGNLVSLLYETLRGG